MNLLEQCREELNRIEAEMTDEQARRVANLVFHIARELLGETLDSKLAELVIESMSERGENKTFRN